MGWVGVGGSIQVLIFHEGLRPAQMEVINHLPNPSLTPPDHVGSHQAPSLPLPRLPLPPLRWRSSDRDLVPAYCITPQPFSRPLPPSLTSCRYNAPPLNRPHPSHPWTRSPTEEAASPPLHTATQRLNRPGSPLAHGPPWALLATHGTALTLAHGPPWAAPPHEAMIIAGALKKISLRAARIFTGAS